MINTEITRFDLQEDSLKEEIFDYVISLFGINDDLVLDKSLDVASRIDALKNTEKKVIDLLDEDLKENETTSLEAIEKAKKSYLVKILRDFLNVSNYSFVLTNENIISFTQKQMGKIQDLKDRYSECNDLIFKRLLFEEVRVLSNDELKRFIEKGMSTDEFSEMIKKAKKTAKNLCKSAYEEEISKINKIKKENQIKKLKKITKITSSILAIIIVIASIKFSTYYFFNIESIYKNQYLKNAKVSMEAIAYPPQLKDSMNPTVNETRQKQRLDYIRDLNSRYFKTIDLFLNPNLNKETIKTSLKDISIPDGLNNISTITLVRNNLNIFTQNEWEENFNPLIGPNVLTQLRAYGAIANFLMPPLAHHIVKDLNGLPVNSLSIYNPPNEKEILSGYEPKDYLINHDKTYESINKNVSELLKRLLNRKKELMKTYNETQSREVKESTKNSLHAIALIESRILDLSSKIKARRDYIIKNNTYRLPLE